MAGDAFKMQAGVFIVNIPYRGTAPAIADVVAGQVELMFSAVGVAQAQVRAGKLKALGVTSERRLPAYPDVPAIAEVLPGYELSSWYGFFVPAGAPAAVVAKINADTRTVFASDEFRESLKKRGVEVQASTPEEFGSYVRAELAKWSKVVKDAAIKPQ